MDAELQLHAIAMRSLLHHLHQPVRRPLRVRILARRRLGPRLQHQAERTPAVLARAQALPRHQMQRQLAMRLGLDHVRALVEQHLDECEPARRHHREVCEQVGQRGAALRVGRGSLVWEPRQQHRHYPAHVRHARRLCRASLPRSPQRARLKPRGPISCRGQRRGDEQPAQLGLRPRAVRRQTVRQRLARAEVGGRPREQRLKELERRACLAQTRDQHLLEQAVSPGCRAVHTAVRGQRVRDRPRSRPGAR
eukprot:2394743-Rhodomonas_salina.2